MKKHIRKQVLRLLKPHSAQLFFAFLSLVIATGLTIPLPILSKNLINSIIGSEAVSTPFGVFVVLFLTLLLLKEFLTYFSYYLFETRMRVFTASLRKLVFEAFQNNYEEFSSYESGRMLTYVNSDPERLQTFFYPTFVHFLKDALTFSFALLVGLHLNAMIAGVSILPLFIFFVLIRYVNPVVRRLSRESIESQTEFVSRLNEYIDGMEMFRVYLRELFSVQKFSEFNEMYATADIRRIKSIVMFNLPLTILFNSGYIVALLMGVYCVRHDMMEIGSLFAILMAVNYLYDSSKNLWDFNIHWEEIRVVEDRLSEVLKEYCVGADKRYRDREKTGSVRKIETIKVEIPSFSYGEGRSLLENFELEAKLGEVVGLIGKSGRGKSTLIKIILGLLGREEGYVKVNGVSLNQIEPDVYYSRIGYVPQHPIVFKGTVKENVFLGEDGQLVEVLLELLDDLSPERDVEEGGRNLSGGEIQRIALCRAFVLKDKDLYLLDEPTAHLDAKRAEKVKELIGSKAKDSIILIVSHSVDLVKELADKVVEI